MKLMQILFIKSTLNPKMQTILCRILSSPIVGPNGRDGREGDRSGCSRIQRSWRGAREVKLVRGEFLAKRDAAVN